MVAYTRLRLVMFALLVLVFPVRSEAKECQAYFSVSDPGVPDELKGEYLSVARLAGDNGSVDECDIAEIYRKHPLRRGGTTAAFLRRDDFVAASGQIDHTKFFRFLLNTRYGLVKGSEWLTNQLIKSSAGRKEEAFIKGQMPNCVPAIQATLPKQIRGSKALLDDLRELCAQYAVVSVGDDVCDTHFTGSWAACGYTLETMWTVTWIPVGMGAGILPVAVLDYRRVVLDSAQRYYIVSTTDSDFGMTVSLRDSSASSAEAERWTIHASVPGFLDTSKNRFAVPEYVYRSFVREQVGVDWELNDFPTTLEVEGELDRVGARTGVALVNGKEQPMDLLGEANLPESVVEAIRKRMRGQ